MAVTKSWNEPFAGATPRSSPKARIGEVEDRVGQVGRVDQLGVVDEDPDPAGEPDPVAVGRVVLGRDRVEQRVGERLQPPGLVEKGDRARTLGDEDVGRRVVALGVDQQGQFARVAVADVDAEVVVLGELLEQRPDEVGCAPGVDGQPVVRRAGRGGHGQHEPAQGQSRPPAPCCRFPLTKVHASHASPACVKVA